MIKKTRYSDPCQARESKRYREPVPSREAIVQVLEYVKKPLSYKELSNELKIEAQQEEGFLRRVRAMLRDGQLVENRRGYLVLCKNMQLKKARVRILKSGLYQLVFLDQSLEECMLEPRQSAGLMQDDRVLVRMSPDALAGEVKVIIVDILERGCTHLVGRYRLHRRGAYLNTSNRLYPGRVLVEEAKGDALMVNEDDYVLARITTYPDRYQDLIVEIEKVLGDHNKAGLERALVVNTFNLHDRFPQQVLDEAAALERQGVADQSEEREDWREDCFVTIDGEDAKDFDDAVYVAAHGSGWLVKVAIADVSHYVRPGSALDQEAFERATSVYLPGSVIPMLPEALSNDLCSLMPHTDRLVLGVTMQLNAQAQVEKVSFAKAVIHSKARLTYTQVADFVETLETQFSHMPVRGVLIGPMLEKMHNLYQGLLKNRLARGALEISLPQSKARLSASRQVEGFYPEQRLVSHRMIEELMLLANEQTADFLLKNKLKGVYRNHKKPDAKKFSQILPLLKSYGISVREGASLTHKVFQQVLLDIGKLPCAQALTPLVLSCMAQAEYSPSNLGHFGLAFTHYCHFTSPIRRYPDLLVHRVLSAYLAPSQESPPEKSVQHLDSAKHASFAERRADEASRFALHWLKCDFIAGSEGQVFHATISSVRAFGLFVTLDAIGVDGMVHISQLQNDYYDYDARLMRLVGRESGRTYRLGDRIRVVLIKVDTVENLIDFKLAK